MPRPVSDRITTMRLPLSKDNFATIINVYAPTMTNPNENKEVFYNQLASVLSDIPRTDKLLLIGDFNARIGRANDKWPLVMGNHGIGKCNSNGELLLALCSEFELIVTNTMSKQKDERKTTWMHSSFIITRCRDKMDIHSTRAMRGANCWTNHQMLRSKVAFRIRQKHNRQGSSKPTKLNTAKLSTISHRESLSRRWTVLSPNVRRRKTQHQTRNGQLCSRSCTTQPRHILASQAENTTTGSTPTTRSYRLL
ncbi:hypothetical protein NP493_1105g00008 [Ridgeia piscesae]|uniref:Craniofacial development protein 2-like n=1 Tax=Ridgeia piscesae TaxID=27915 RepID=A0AAD9NJZ6_RIDPI|nr:hypothetical protein NP493_1105g00008 [Ridgeia piscesae]